MICIIYLQSLQIDANTSQNQWFIYWQPSAVWVHASAFKCDRNEDLFQMSQYEFKQGVIKQSHSLPDTDVVGLFCMGTLCPLLG